MRWVKSAEEIERIQALLVAPVFADSRVLSVQFETTGAFVRAVLPPGLEPDGEATGHAFIGEFRASNCVGPFNGAGVFVRARHGDLRGNYCLTMPMSTDAAVIFGRELYGEPKKLAAVQLERDGDRVTGTVTRYGVPFLELRARLSEAGLVGTGTGSTFHYKFTPAADGSGFDGNPLLIHIRSENLTRTVERGAGEIIVRESQHDPVADMPVVRVLGAAYTEGDTHTFGRTLCVVDGAAFLPYAFAKMDDLTLLGAGTLTAAT